MLTFLNMIFFSLIALAPYMLAQRHSLTGENFFLGFYCNDLKFPKCFCNKLFAFYLSLVDKCQQQETITAQQRQTAFEV